jgi:hypothetical protein
MVAGIMLLTSIAYGAYRLTAHARDVQVTRVSDGDAGHRAQEVAP